MDENVNWMKLTNLLLLFSLNLKAPFYTSTFTPKKAIAFLDVHTREKKYLYVMYTMCANRLK